MTKPSIRRLSRVAATVLMAGNIEAAFSIMPVGDSLTEQPFRYFLQRELEADGFIPSGRRGADFDFVGSRSGQNANGQSGPWEVFPWDTDHEGNGGGWTVDFLMNGFSRWGTDPASQKRYYGLPARRSAGHWDEFGGAPDIVLLWAGVNDLYHMYFDPGSGPLGENNRPGLNIIDSTLTDFHELIDWFRSINPDVTILLASGTPSLDPEVNAFEFTYADFVGALVAEHGRGGFDDPTGRSDIRMVDLWTGFDTTTMLHTGDGLAVHLSQAGMEFAAKRWADALKPVLIPEPGTTALLTAFAALLVCRRRR